MLIKPKSNKRINPIAIVNILCTSNNMLINVSNLDNETIYFSSNGFLGIKGSRRSTSYAGQANANIIGKKLYLLGVRYLYIKIKGFGHGRYSSLKGFHLSGIKILSIFKFSHIYR